MTRNTSLPLAAVAALAAAGVYWFLGSGEPTASPTTQPLSTPAPEIADEPPIPTPVAPPTPVGAVMTREIPGETPARPLIEGIMLQKGELEWEKRIREITENTQTSDPDKARRLFEILPTLPVEGREAAAEQALKLVRDRDYRVAETMVINPATYGPAMEMLWADLMERPDAITLPTLMKIVRNPSHPYAPTAKDNLELLLGKNYGNDWARWEAAIAEHLNRKDP